ncbi:MAG: hypothetical protein D6780_01905 [Candidatus Dadabacteria bacterium]|nr:MAG: hypothetical protein D6780_01905 [Candidatus Dadabacteria bacterium]
MQTKEQFSKVLDALRMLEQLPESEGGITAYALDRKVKFSSRSPNDPRYPAQTALNSHLTPDADINAPEAWGIVNNATRNVVVAIIDTGIWPQPVDARFANRNSYFNFWVNEGECAGGYPSGCLYNGVDDDGNGYVDDFFGVNVAPSGYTDLLDRLGHGTAVASVAGAKTDNLHLIAGAGWKPQIMTVKTGEGSGGYLFAVIAGINYAGRMGADIVNRSGGSFGFLPNPECDAIRNWPNTLFVVSAGNQGVDLSDPNRFPYLPCECPSFLNLICVAASTFTGRLASYSNYGISAVHLAAPGTALVYKRGGGIRIALGTSFAAPFVSGVAALVKARHPSMSATDIGSIILSTVRPDCHLEGKVLMGGIVCASKAVGGVSCDPITDCGGSSGSNSSSSQGGSNSSSSSGGSGSCDICDDNPSEDSDYDGDSFSDALECDIGSNPCDCRQPDEDGCSYGGHTGSSSSGGGRGGLTGAGRGGNNRGHGNNFSSAFNSSSSSSTSSSSSQSSETSGSNDNQSNSSTESSSSGESQSSSSSSNSESFGNSSSSSSSQSFDSSGNSSSPSQGGGQIGIQGNVDCPPDAPDCTGHNNAEQQLFK